MLDKYRLKMGFNDETKLLEDITIGNLHSFLKEGWKRILARSEKIK